MRWCRKYITVVLVASMHREAMPNTWIRKVGMLLARAAGASQ
jgi:hypothetical protein